MPWWIINYFNTSNPLHTWQYLNIGLATSGYEFGEWWWKQSANYNSIKSIINNFTLNYFFNFIKNILKVGYHLILSLNVLFFVLFLRYRQLIKYKSFVVLFLPSFLFFILLVSQAFVFSEVFLSWYLIFIIYFSVITGLNFGSNYFKIIIFIFLFISIKIFYSYLSNYNDDGQLSDNSLIIPIIKAQDSNMENKFIMSIHPARSYYLNSKYLTLPLYFEGSVSDLICYKGLHFNILKTIPTYPSNLFLGNKIVKADYLIFEKSTLKYLPQFIFLFDPNSLNIPSNFKLLYLSKSCVVYKII